MFMKRNKTKCAACCTIAAFLSIVSCTPSFLKKAGWEGIHGDTLRVYITLDIPEDMGQYETDKSMPELLLAAGKKRGQMLLALFLREHIHDPDRSAVCRGAIDGIINDGKMIDHECGYDSCAAFLDFNIRNCIDAGDGTLPDINK